MHISKLNLATDSIDLTPWSDPHESNPHGSNPHGSNPHESNPQNKFKEIAHFEAKWGLELLVENLWKIFKNL